MTAPQGLSESYCAGVGYVLEGSALGAAVLRRQLLAMQADAPTFYLDQLLSDRNIRWRQFCTWLNRSQRSKPQLATACTGAMDTFTLVQATLDHPGAPVMETRSEI